MNIFRCKKDSKGFTVMELIIVISIMGILTATMIPAVNKMRLRAYYARALSEFKSISGALELYREDNSNQYPADAIWSLPAELEPYVAGSSLPEAPWPNSYFDWDNGFDPDTGEQIYQISIRFCPEGGPIEECHFPAEDWTSEFGINSSLYYCIEGPCRAHLDEAIEYPGKCVNCETEA